MAKQKHPEDDEPEAWVKWRRKRFPAKRPNQDDLAIELEAELETDRDLSKPIPQLLCDFHDQAERALKSGDPSTRLVLNAQKRMVAMMAKVAMKNQTLSSIMIGLTIVIAALTVALVGLTIVLIFQGRPE